MGSISALGVKCGLSLLVLYSVPRGFSTDTPVFPSHQKQTFDFISFDLKKTIIVNSDLSYVDLISSKMFKLSLKNPLWRVVNIKYYYYHY